ncbi:DUF350 domain-containing protein [Salisediminibacterium selenitireducens]|uniref:DUF350 domain-containing protein n=1 Tax=Bacillus selenitireducens (strain ATCC 700615 / DSM 15326 / MLS10) TaxID=439292 RepID=D6XSW5_BACIE|nr:DUF350 domain-containing protein [Salisediminibacterium selenitireducens]ADH98901.1 protein of unknown function DUF350 [[Bacillus] selenitireducens MLS10]
MNELFANEWVYTAGVYSLTVMAIIVSLSVFEAVTSYKTWDEIRSGNVAVALSIGGKIFGIANIFRHSITANDSILTMLMWGVYGFALLLFVYVIFEFLTPGFSVDKELAHDNRAVGIVSFILSVALSYVIGSSIVLFQ